MLRVLKPFQKKNCCKVVFVTRVNELLSKQQKDYVLSSGKNKPDAGLEPAAVGLKVQRSTDWANQALSQWRLRLDIDHFVIQIKVFYAVLRVLFNQLRHMFQLAFFYTVCRTCENWPSIALLIWTNGVTVLLVDNTHLCLAMNVKTWNNVRLGKKCLS